MEIHGSDINGFNYKFNCPELKSIWNIFMSLSDSIFFASDISIGKRGSYTLSCESIMSAMNTIVSIDFCVRRYAFGDAYTLVRKIRDDILQYLFLLSVIQNQDSIFEEMHNIQMEEMTLSPDKFVQFIEHYIETLQSGKGKEDFHLAMESWLFNDLENDDNGRYRKTYFAASKYRNFLIEKNKSVKYIYEGFLNQIWRDIDRKLNNYVHGNGIKYIVNNYVHPFNKKTEEKKISDLIRTVESITIIFLSILALIDSVKMHSSDYIDTLDIGCIPEDDSQYWVLPCIVEFMNEKIERKWLEFIQEHEGRGMKFLKEYY